MLVVKDSATLSNMTEKEIKMERDFEYYCVKPNLKQIVGRKVTKDLKFDEYNEDKSVHQILDNCVLTTIIQKEYEQGEYKIKEDSKTEVTYPEGTILLWSDALGYLAPEMQVCTLDELKEEIEQYRDIYKKGE